MLKDTTHHQGLNSRPYDHEPNTLPTKPCIFAWQISIERLSIQFHSQGRKRPRAIENEFRPKMSRYAIEPWISWLKNCHIAHTIEVKLSRRKLYRSLFSGLCCHAPYHIDSAWELYKNIHVPEEYTSTCKLIRWACWLSWTNI